MVLKLPRLKHDTPLADEENKPTRELTRFWDSAMSAIEGGLRSVSNGIVVAITGSGEVLTRTLQAGTGITLTNPDGIAGNPGIAITDTAVTPASYGDATHVGSFTVDQQGRLTAASNTLITVAGLALTAGDIWVGNVSNVAVAVAPSGDVTMTNAGVFTIKTDVSLAGNPTTTTQTALNNSTRIATTAYVDAAVTAGGGVTKPYVVNFGMSGSPLVNSQALYLDFEFAVTFPANFGAITGGQTSGASGTANATASTVFTIAARSASPNTWGTGVGTITIGAGGVTATFATAGGTAYTTAAGEKWRVLGPVSADATFANLIVSLVGTR